MNGITVNAADLDCALQIIDSHDPHCDDKVAARLAARDRLRTKLDEWYAEYRSTGAGNVHDEAAARVQRWGTDSVTGKPLRLGDLGQPEVHDEVAALHYHYGGACDCNFGEEVTA